MVGCRAIEEDSYYYYHLKSLDNIEAKEKLGESIRRSRQPGQHDRPIMTGQHMTGHMS